MPDRVKLAVFISGRGTGLQALIDASKAGTLSAQIVLVVSSRSHAPGLERARKEGIQALEYESKNYPTIGEVGDWMLRQLKRAGAEYVALAGFLKMIPRKVLQAYPGRVVNIHPALLPNYGGKGMYGHFVHEAVIAAQDKESGATVHLVDEIYDHGAILEQIRVPVLANDTPETLAERVLKEEHTLYPIALEKLIQGKYELNHD